MDAKAKKLAARLLRAEQAKAKKALGEEWQARSARRHDSSDDDDEIPAEALAGANAPGATLGRDHKQYNPPRGDVHNPTHTAAVHVVNEPAKEEQPSGFGEDEDEKSQPALAALEVVEPKRAVLGPKQRARIRAEKQRLTAEADEEARIAKAKIDKAAAEAQALIDEAAELEKLKYLELRAEEARAEMAAVEAELEAERIKRAAEKEQEKIERAERKAAKAAKAAAIAEEREMIRALGDAERLVCFFLIHFFAFANIFLRRTGH